MKPTIKHSVFCTLLVFLFATGNAQEKTGFVNFNLGNTTLKTTNKHSITLYGCNTSITANSSNWRGPKSFKWNTPNQVLSNIPFGHQRSSKTNEYYYISKYYIASPPVIQLANPTDSIDNPNTLYDIGIVTPDNVALKGEKPVQMVYLNYDILKTMHIQYIKLKMDPSFEHLGVDLIPFKVECGNFPWIAKNGIVNAKGASGIGDIKRNTSNTSRLFLPYYYENHTKTDKKYLDCSVTLLNDILFHRFVYFKIDGKKQTTINLKDYYQKYGDRPLTLHAEYRKSLASGCKKPQYQE